MDSKIINNSKYLLTDLLEGDDKIVKREDFSILSNDELQEVLSIIVNNPKLSEDEKKYYLLNSWRIHYRVKPPTMEEFLTPEWLGPTAFQVHSHVKKVLCDFWSPTSKYRHLLLAAHIRWGKMGRMDTKIYTPDGFTLMKDIKVGDIVSTPNGKTSRVIQIFPQGIQDIYEVTFKDGRKTFVGAEHLWKVNKDNNRNENGFMWEIKTTIDIFSNGLYKGDNPIWKVPLTNPVFHKGRKHIIPPYTLGVLLSKKFSYKGIPLEYLYDSIDNRISLLSGILETKGSINTKSILLRTNSIPFRDSLIELVRGLGGLASWESFRRKISKNEGYIISIYFPENKISYLSIISIKKVSPAEAQCILLDDEDHLYLTDDYIVTHNSYSTVFSSLYTIAHLWCMRNPQKFFPDLTPASTIVQALISFNLTKAKQVLLQPFFQLLLTSPKFERVLREDRIEVKQRDCPDSIIWTTAGKVGAIQFSGGVHIVIGSTPGHLLGLDILTIVFSEISFFIEQGISIETIWRIYNDGKTRIEAQFGKRYFATSIIDSSPNDMELSPIDKYIFSGEAAKNPLNYIVTGQHWNSFPDKYPIYKITGETFPVYRGSGSKPPKLLTAQEISDYSPTEIFNVPIDAKQLFKDNLEKSVKDLCGWPSSSQSRLITDFSIIDNLFSNNLNNIYTYIYAPADSNPEGLIWNQIKDKFFIKIGNGDKYEFYRSPNEQRFLHIDQSESGDLASIGMVHPELDKNGNIVQVGDFTIIINPSNGKKVNLDAIIYFIEDLRTKGRILLKRKKGKDSKGKVKNVDLGKITFDNFESATGRQRLNRLGYPVDRLSVDRTINPYLTFISWMSNNRIKLGRNIIIKNNLKSLIEVKSPSGKRKADHMKGDIVYDDGGNWITSLMGINAKDGSDSFCGAVWNSIQFFEGIPIYQWEDISVRDVSNSIDRDMKDLISYNGTDINKDVEDMEKIDDQNQKEVIGEKEKAQILLKISERFGLTISN